MQVAVHIKWFSSQVGACVVRWLEVLGQNPPPARDHGICAWHYLQRRRRRGEAPRSVDRPPVLGAAAVDDPHMVAGLSRI